ncbi:T9SS type A sorting domain-containing protein [Neolewinella antarctica]|uniref:Secretion system C-terminal sorting domain-containing protein n=1 Tax=Neolewinella antarctica TaxID=442734 RepID=A0ABX0X9G9_9BACT|nr:T9SS type A sorting domain-containing protein [Neolewinella antarctica]NJC25458.1 hypothetical protein [Neolewinella antarctica]
MSVRSFAVLSLLFALPLTAQEVLTSAYFPTPGDTLRTNVADSTWATTLDFQFAGGDDLSWDFSNPVSDRQRSAPVDVADDVDFPNAALVITIDPFNRVYYVVEESTFKIVGAKISLDLFPGFEISAPVDPARPERHTDLQPGDVLTNSTSNVTVIPFDSIPAAARALLPDLPLRIDFLRLTTTILRTDSVDAFGTVRLGDNFYSTIREKRTETIDLKIEAKSSIFPYVDITQIIADSAPELAGDVGTQAPVTTYYWWNNDSKEAVAEVRTNDAGAFEEMTYKRALAATSTRGLGAGQALVKIYPNPASASVTFEVANLPRDQYVLTLINAAGRKMLTRTFSARGNQAKIAINVSDFPGGLYVANLRNVRGLTLASRRIIVN